MKKIYQSIIFKHLSFVLELEDGTKMDVNFTGGSTYPRKTNGVFVTTDDKIQKALEKNDAFNKQYRLIYKDGKHVYDPNPVYTIEQKYKLLEKKYRELSMKLEDCEKAGGSNAEMEDLKRTNDKLINEMVEKDLLIEKLKKQNENQYVKKEKPVKEQPKESTEPGLKAVEEVSTLQEARNYLHDKFGVDKGRITNRKAIKNKAAEMGVAFPKIEL